MMAKRKRTWKGLCLGLATCFSFCTQFCLSQSIQTFADKKDILIGEQVQLKIKVVFVAGNNLRGWLSLPDSIPHFDIVERGEIDSTVSGDNSKTFEQTIIFTSFDSGRWVFPSLPVGGLQTDSIIINVSYSPTDSTNQLRDIKPIVPVSLVDYMWYYIAGGIVLLLLIIFLLYLYFKKKKKETPAGPKSKLSPYDEAIQELAKLSQYNLQDAGEVRSFHTRLSGIFKRYTGRKENKDLLNKTTSDLLVRMKDKMSQENISILATALRCTDAVKFAKYFPSPAESEDCKQKIKETVNLIEQQQTGNDKQ